MNVVKCDKCGSESVGFYIRIGENKSLSAFRPPLLEGHLCRKCSEEVRAFVFNIGSLIKS